MRLELSCEDFIDHEAQTCCFNSEQFVKLLEYANTLVTMGQMMIASSSNENIGEPKQEDIDKMNGIIALAEGLMSCDENITEIISGETAAFFAGSKSEEETAELIQQRVDIVFK